MATTSPGLSKRHAQFSIPRNSNSPSNTGTFGELGDMHHNPAKNVLHVDQSLLEWSKETGGASLESLPSPVVTKLGAKLLAARALRPTPFIDRTLYTAWNAMAVTAYLEAARVLRIDAAANFALLTLDRLLKEAWDGDSDTAPRHRLRAEQTPTAETRSRHARRLRLYRFTPASTPGWPAARCVITTPRKSSPTP